MQVDGRSALWLCQEDLRDRNASSAFSDKDFLCNRFTQGTADADDDQRDAEKHKGDEGVDRPEVKLWGRKGHMQERFDHDDENTRQDGSSAENEEIASSDIAGERDHRGHDERRPEDDGERKGDEPLASCEFTDEKEIQGDRCEVAGDEDDGIRSGEPHRQKDRDVRERERADGIQRPIQFIEDRYLANDELDGEHDIEHRDEEEQTASVDARMRSSVRRVIGSDCLLRELGMEYCRSAKRTAFFGVGKLNAAFDAKHMRIPFFHVF